MGDARPGPRDEPTAARTVEPSAAPGLYDLPSLLSRIWSVPAAAKLATSGSFATPRGPAPPRMEELQDLHPEARSHESPAALTGWPPAGYGVTSSLPLAAVPSLTLSLPERVIEERDRPPITPEPPEPFFSTGIQYIAWRHPPCRLGYGAPLPRGLHCGRGIPDWHAGRELVPIAGRLRGVESDRMMPLARTSWMLHRYELPLPA
ncbi:MAG: hypothetical protein WBG19_06910 [Thermoplasmata archaeon]